jgi:hypothetical protein
MKILPIILFFYSFTTLAQKTPISKELIQRLHNTELLNNQEVLKNLNLPRKGLHSPKNFKLTNPYEPYASRRIASDDNLIEINGITNYKDKIGHKVKFYQQEVVHQWFNVQSVEERKSEYCAFKFVDTKKKRYVLQTFESANAALGEGFTVTHQYHCGGCSSLKDLAVYLDKLNLTEPARICSKKLDIQKVKECYMEKIGFSETCAESWAYNSRNTRKSCIGICVKDYGLINLMMNRYPPDLTNPDGSLKPCLQCDELRSVPGYLYSAGRSRRGSGIIADIERDPEDIYHIDYKIYYDLFDLMVPAN